MFTKIDCIRLYVPDIEQGLEYYHVKLELPIAWKKEHEVGFLMEDGVGELVIQDIHHWQETDISVKDVAVSVKHIVASGGKVIEGPFDIAIGKCAIVADPWGNKMVILDTTKGKYETDETGNVLNSIP